MPTRRYASNDATSKPHGVQSLGVIGAGQMGLGIALVGARVAQLPVRLMDVSQDQLDKGLRFMDKLLEKDVQRGRLTAEEKQQVQSRVSVVRSVDELASTASPADLIVEAVSERVDLKLSLFRDLSEATAPNTILASNTSSISITKIAGASLHPERVIGMHFMNPVPVMKLVEVIPGLATSQQTIDTTLAVSHAMGKTTTLSQDVPGFIANRLLMPYINEAVFALQEGIATREDIDTTMRLGTNVPMGPLTLADFIGLDTCLAIMRVLHTQLGDTKYRPAVLLQKYVDAGWLGKKTGRGFYEY
ncbi:3-hydroxyacyl-CoA dehydrogenase [Thamnocephalis sphaerospora]|uniref:3-hydroxyacyl-CoA dehydrogenase n=1 Tax=Thamnocephalis sphaerospora TaxID=78915 RepID=A0A4P9XX21_9FUNG|nr:3-hydroxyacyl-CoA dehydrogenase [Thamnocephalis sphaerospora]|eukprot:RKP10552.1 3-hydroxyacyl-CoA dehydrogenase [Thamnocephalis sphaerospora]